MDNLSQQVESRRSQRLQQRSVRGQQSINDWLQSQPLQPQQQSPIHEPRDNTFEQAGQQTDTDVFSDAGSNRNSEILDGQQNTRDLLLEIRRDVKRMNTKFDSLEKSVHDLKRDNRQLKQQNRVITNEINQMKTAFSKLEVRTTEAEKKNENLEAQSRRDNLKFFGFQDDDKETWEQSEDKVREYIRTELNINDSDIKIERAHRLPSKNSPRPIIVKFSFYKDKDNVLRTYRQKRKDENNERNERNVRNNDATDSDAEMAPRIRVTEDFPERVTKARTKLFPFLKSCMDNEVNAYLRYDSLVVEGQSYSYDYELKRPVLNNK